MIALVDGRQVHSNLRKLSLQELFDVLSPTSPIDTKNLDHEVGQRTDFFVCLFSVIAFLVVALDLLFFKQLINTRQSCSATGWA